MHFGFGCLVVSYNVRFNLLELFDLLLNIDIVLVFLVLYDPIHQLVELKLQLHRQVLFPLLELSLLEIEQFLFTPHQILSDEESISI